jgi:hypothetical protein
VIVHDLDIGWALLRPTEAYAPLVVDPHGVLTLPILSQRFEPVRGWHIQVGKPFGRVQRFKLATSNPEYLRREPLRAPTIEYSLSDAVPETPYQGCAPRPI